MSNPDYVVIVIPNWISLVLALLAAAAGIRAWVLARRNRRVTARAEQIIKDHDARQEEQR